MAKRNVQPHPGGLRLAQLIAAQGRQRQWVAAEIGTTNSRLARICRGESRLSLAEAKVLAAIFDVPHEDFLSARSKEAAA